MNYLLICTDFAKNDAQKCNKILLSTNTQVGLPRGRLVVTKCLNHLSSLFDRVAFSDISAWAFALCVRAVLPQAFHPLA